MKRILTSVPSILCLALLSLSAQAHELTAAIASPDCDSRTIKLTFEGARMEARPYFVEYTIFLAPTGGGDSIKIEGRIPPEGYLLIEESTPDNPGGNDETFINMITVDVPELAGSSVLVSGSADLYQRDPWRDIYYGNYDITNADGATSFEVNCESALGSLGDTVWEDLNGDGLFQEGFEPGVDEVEVLLTNCGDIIDAANVLDTKFTANGGLYLFENLEDGDYCVVFEKPDGFTCTTPNVVDAANDDTNDSDGKSFGDICVTDTVTLGAGQTDLTVDLGLVQTASLGNFVWEDLNGDGIQDANEPGVNDVDVYLYMTDTNGECTIPMGLDKSTTATVDNIDGIYGFDGLEPGNYCVQFDISTLTNYCEPGDPVFTSYTPGNDSDDSDANPENAGKSDSVALAAGDENTTLDAGIYCPARLGDRVWIDTDRDGQQDCVDTNGDDIIGNDGTSGQAVGNECENGERGVTVFLAMPGDDGCTPDDYDITSPSTFTDEFGFYSFDGLVPGDYCVAWVPPANYDCTAANSGNDVSDSDGVFDETSGLCSVLGTPITLNSGDETLTVDLGLSLPPLDCGLTLDKSCRVAAPPPQDFDKCDGKLQQFTLLATANISGIALANPDNGTGVSTTSVTAGNELTVFGPFSNNDVEIIFDGGQSVFHMSCSDEDFNDPSDCGKEAGDGKSNDPAYDNTWLLEGFIDNSDRVLDCNSNSDEGFTDSCTFEKPLAPSCETTGDPDMLTWSFDGGSGSCDDSTFALLQKDFECTGSVDEGLNISIVDDKGVSYSVGPDGEFTMQRDGAKEITLSNSGGTQTIVLHTSCSQPIIVGETAGALTLVAMDGLTGGTDVTYRYVVSNNDSGDPLTGVKVTDDLLGDIGGPISLGTGDSETFYSDPVTLFETTSNTGKATGMLADGVMCGPEGDASDSVTVTVTEPTCDGDVSIMLEKVEDKKIKWKLSNSSRLDATIDTLTLSWGWDGNSLLKKVKFDGNDIVKDEAIESEADLPANALVGSSEWLKEVKDRTLKAGDSGKTLEFEFTENFPLKQEQPADEFDLTVNFSDGSETGCSVTF